MGSRCAISNRSEFPAGFTIEAELELSQIGREKDPCFPPALEIPNRSEAVSEDNQQTGLLLAALCSERAAAIAEPKETRQNVARR